MDVTSNSQLLGNNQRAGFAGHGQRRDDEQRPSGQQAFHALIG